MKSFMSWQCIEQRTGRPTTIEAFTDPGSAQVTIVITCAACEKEIKRRTFDASDPEHEQIAATFGELDAKAYLQHPHVCQVASC